jgi:hypothetical protein
MRNTKRQPFGEESIPVADEEAFKAIPVEFLQNLRFMVRYSPVKKAVWLWPELRVLGRATSLR